MAAAKQNILTTPPTPKYAVNADLDGKVVYLGLDVDHVPIEPGKDVTLTHYWKLVASPGAGLEDVHAPQRRQQELHQRRSRAGEGEVPGGRLEGGRDHPRPAQHPPARELGGADGRGLRRLVARGDAHAGQGGTARRRGARAGGDDPGQREARRARRSASATSCAWSTKAPKIDGKLDDAAWASAPSTGAFVNTMTGAAVRAEDRGEAAVGQEVPLRRHRQRRLGRLGEAGQARRQAVDRGGGRDDDRRRRQRAQATSSCRSRPTATCSTPTCPNGASTRTRSTRR